MAKAGYNFSCLDRKGLQVLNKRLGVTHKAFGIFLTTSHEDWSPAQVAYPSEDQPIQKLRPYQFTSNFWLHATIAQSSISSSSFTLLFLLGMTWLHPTPSKINVTSNDHLAVCNSCVPML